MRNVLKPLRKAMPLVLLIFFCGIVTAYAFSSVAHKKWHSRLEKGEYKGAVDEETEGSESTKPNVYVIVSDPIQIPVNIDGLAVETDEEII